MSRTSLRNWAREEFMKEKAKVKVLLHQSPSKIHISFDIWSSPNRFAVLGVVAHFVKKQGEEYRNQACLLALKRLTERHGAEEIAEELIRVVLDLARVDPTETDPDSRRARCIGHILNLAARDFIYGKDVEAFEFEVAGEDVNARFDSAAARKAQEVWRSKGPIGKLHNLIVFIRASAQRSEAFRKIRIGDEKIDDLEPILDNDTRWLSHYSSIERAIKLKPRLDTFAIRYHDQIKADTLTDDDWVQLNEIVTALKPFQQAQKSLQGSAGNGRHGSIWEWLVTIEGLRKKIKTGQKEIQAKYSNDHQLAIAYQQCWQKIDKYYLESDKQHIIYAASTLIIPYAHKAFFDKNWDKVWVRKMLKTVEAHYKKHYLNLDITEDAEQSEEEEPSMMDLELEFSSSHKVVDDEFKSYINQPKLPYKVDPLTHWAQATGYPKLRQMAIDLISIPAMSAEVERVFSSAKRLLTPDRHATTAESLEIYELLRNWWFNDLIIQTKTEEEEENTA